MSTKTAVVIKKGVEIPAEWKRLVVRKKTTVTVREPNGDKEEIPTKYGVLEAVAGQDWVVEKPDGSIYSCKKDIFANTYEEVAGKPGHFVKNVTTTVVEIPEEVDVTLKTLEGDEKGGAPDFIAIGSKDEVYFNSREFFENELEVVG